MNIKPTGYWTFFCNPAKWEIDKFLSSGEEYDDYQVTPWQEEFFQPGQLGIVRVGGDKRTLDQLSGRKKLQRGIYGIVQVLTTPKIRVENLDEFWISGTEEAKSRKIVEIRYLKNLLNNPLLLQDLEKDSKITDVYLKEGFQASSMPLDKETFERIIELIGNENIFENIKTEPTETIQEIQEIENKYANAVPEVKEVISKKIERGTIGNKVKQLADYKCMMCQSLGLDPIAFYKKDGTPFVEAHHVIPVSNLVKGSLSSNNVIAVCANHHRQIHYGNVELIHNDAEKFIFSVDGKRIEIRKIMINS